MEDDRLAELARVAAEAEKIKAVVQLVEKNRRAEAAVAAHNALDEAEEAVRQQNAKAKADADSKKASEDVEDDIPLRRRTKASAAMKRRMRKRHFEISSAPELKDDIPEEEDTQEDVNDEEDVHMDVDEENLNEDGAPTIENLSDDSTPEREDPETVLEGAQVFAQNVDNEHFMDDVLLG
ncbi:hypothetical protein M5689_018890 [Euphorbia peplus]|nr:hypothetical protein M5689_018890 [Euphorbia peplus]